MSVSEVPPTSASTSPDSPWAAAASAFSRWREGDTEGLDRDRAEDVVQTTWIALVDHADTITSPQAIAAWLCTSARREAWRAGRQSTRERPVDDQVLAQGLPDHESPEHQVLLDD